VECAQGFLQISSYIGKPHSCQRRDQCSSFDVRIPDTNICISPERQQEDLAFCKRNEYRSNQNSCIRCSPLCDSCVDEGQSKCINCATSLDWPVHWQPSIGCSLSCPEYFQPEAEGYCSECLDYFDLENKRCTKNCIAPYFVDPDDPRLCRSKPKRCRSYRLESDMCLLCEEDYIFDSSRCLDCHTSPGFYKRQPNEPCEEICGDGLDFGLLGCDDGNRINGDGCSSQCQVENDWIISSGSSRLPSICFMDYQVMIIHAIAIIRDHKQVLIHWNRSSGGPDHPQSALFNDQGKEIRCIPGTFDPTHRIFSMECPESIVGRNGWFVKFDVPSNEIPIEVPIEFQPESLADLVKTKAATTLSEKSSTVQDFEIVTFLPLSVFILRFDSSVLKLVPIIQLMKLLVNDTLEFTTAVFSLTVFIIIVLSWAKRKSHDSLSRFSCKVLTGVHLLIFSGIRNLDGKKDILSHPKSTLGMILLVFLILTTLFFAGGQMEGVKNIVFLLVTSFLYLIVTSMQDENNLMVTSIISVVSGGAVAQFFFSHPMRRAGIFLCLMFPFVALSLMKLKGVSLRKLGYFLYLVMTIYLLALPYSSLKPLATWIKARKNHFLSLKEEEEKSHSQAVIQVSQLTE